MESLAFDTLTFDHPAACRPARLTASLHLPEADGPVPLNLSQGEHQAHPHVQPRPFVAARHRFHHKTP